MPERLRREFFSVYRTNEIIRKAKSIFKLHSKNPANFERKTTTFRYFWEQSSRDNHKLLKQVLFIKFL